jgi:hypothetical protein
MRSRLDRVFNDDMVFWQLIRKNRGDTVTSAN